MKWSHTRIRFEILPCRWSLWTFQCIPSTIKTSVYGLDCLPSSYSWVICSICREIWGERGSMKSGKSVHLFWYDLVPLVVTLVFLPNLTFLHRLAKSDWVRCIPGLGEGGLGCRVKDWSKSGILLPNLNNTLLTAVIGRSHHETCWTTLRLVRSRIQDLDRKTCRRIW